MKKLVPQTGGHPFRLNDLMLLQNALIDTATALSGTINAGNNCVLQGCTVAGNNIAGGWIYFGGEIYQAIATVLPSPLSGQTLYWNIVEVTEDPVTLNSPYTVKYQDTVFKGVHKKRTMVPVWATSGAVADSALPRIVTTVVNGGLNPIGGIMMWNGIVANFFTGTGLGIFSMTGWAICNGQNGTTDLRGRFIVGYDPSDADYTNPGQAGGAKAITLTVNQIPAHTHTTAAVTVTSTTESQPHTHNYQDAVADGDTNRGTLQGGAATAQENYYTKTTQNNNQNHTHNITIPQSTSSSVGGGLSHENRPPYYTLVYIQRIS